MILINLTLSLSSKSSILFAGQPSRYPVDENFYEMFEKATLPKNGSISVFISNSCENLMSHKLVEDLIIRRRFPGDNKVLADGLTDGYKILHHFATLLLGMFLSIHFVGKCKYM